MELIQFAKMPYERPDMEAAHEALKALTQKLREAGDYDAARTAFLQKQELDRHIRTAVSLVQIRQSVDTRDPFYDQEKTYWNHELPELQQYQHQWTQAMLTGRFRGEFEKEYGSLIFLNAEIEQKTFAPEILEELKQEAEQKTAYNKLIASAQIPFRDGIYTISQLSPFKNDTDDEVRLAAWKAEGGWYRENQEALDQIYDRLVQLRDRMGRKLGFDGYTQLGYYRMERNCYTAEDVAKFREAVRTFVVPAAEKIFRARAERLGFSWPLSYADAQLEFRSGNPKPAGTAEDILAAGDRFYDALSPETGEFFRTMRAFGLMDVLSTEGKQAGGYCTSLPDYEVPFIFANFNGTRHDVEVVTHEAGHAFAAWMNRKRIPIDSIWPTLEACEVHSMSMEFFAWPYAEAFFGADADKFRFSHLASALTFIPYGTMVDHFQHIIYEKPEMTPKERHAVWKELLGIYQPWLKLDGDIPFYADGEGWQRQQHIYNNPFYYIDYCLAQTVALVFWARIQEDPKAAWDTYMAYTRQGGTETFRKLLENAGLPDPFDPDCLRGVARKAEAWLDASALSGAR